MSFDITSVLKTAVSDSDTGAGQQIIYLPVDRLDPDPDNFYSLAGIDELADSIALIGLQQPLLVRHGSEPGRYTVISGHRRLAAIQLLQDGEDDSAHLFDRGVPCIIELGSIQIIPGSDLDKALQELRLIYANSATRVLSAAEISKQAERIEALLLQLKEQGYSLPGRMRDHVAKICQVSKTKIARLHAIRENLQPELLERFDRGELNESVAYRISQETNSVQSSLAKIAGDSLPQYDVPRVESTLVGIKNPPRIQPAPAEAGSNFDPEAYLKERAEEDREFFKALNRVADQFLRDMTEVESRQHGIEKLKKTFTHASHWIDAGHWQGTPKGLIVNEGTKRQILRTWTETYDVLCTIALNRAALKLKRPARKDPPPSPAGGLTWSTGSPTERGTYETRVGVGDEDTEKTGSWQRLNWDGNDWSFSNGAKLPAGMKVFRWVQLPEV